MSEELPPLWPHQVESIDRAKIMPGFSLFFEPGTGKTRTILEILRHRYNSEKRIKRTLIVAPLIVLSNWRAEIKKFTKIPDEKVFTPEGSLLEKSKQLTDFEGILLINYDAFVSPDFTKAVIAWAPEIAVLDESHRIKNHSSKRTKNLLKISDKMPERGFRYLMTGSPMTNSQLDIWSQFMFLDHGETFGNSFFGFRSTFFYNKNANRPRDGRYFPDWHPKEGIDEEFNRRIKTKASIVKKEECLSLPPLIRQEIEVELSPMQAKHYKEMKRDYITFINGKAATATIALTKLLRMQQIISGFIKTEGGEIERFENPRSRVLGELLGDLCLSSKVICWAVFKEDFFSIRETCTRVGLRFVEVHGDISRDEKEINIKNFKDDKGVRVLIASPASGGIGINLTEARYSIWYSRNFNLEHREQAESRNYRAGSEVHASINSYDLVSRGTLDELILTALKDKKNILENILHMDITKL